MNNNGRPWATCLTKKLRVPIVSWQPVVVGLAATGAMTSERLHSYQTTCHSWIGASRPLTCTAPIDVASPNLSLTACQTVSEINN